MEFIDLTQIRDDLVREGVELYAKAKAEGREMSTSERERDEEIDFLLRKVAAQIKVDQEEYGRPVHLRVVAANDNPDPGGDRTNDFIFSLVED